ncbi:Sorting nexin-29 [Ataeniobius toweri]|uniref:Sorting nexin-29 n=1 Tax=Ataeniobius toweri TaxID=208326 RepID=A0ABU7A2Y7_9TELE|nr:Sorting nexin-29 [Ataeniobius toweri]
MMLLLLVSLRAHRALINVWIPSVFLQGRAANTYHVYQVYIRILDNEWNVYRRYTEFRELHNQLRTQFPQADTFNFPPKKAIGNKMAIERRSTPWTFLLSITGKHRDSQYPDRTHACSSRHADSMQKDPIGQDSNLQASC